MKKLILPLFLVSFAMGYSQENLVVAGGDASGSGGTVNYSYGQVFYEPIEGSNGAITQGVQQPIEFYVLSTHADFLTFNVALYPNPAYSYVTLDLDLSQFKDSIKFELFSLNGKLIKTGKLMSNQTDIQVDDLAAAIYLLNISSSKKVIKTFKLLKNNQNN